MKNHFDAVKVKGKDDAVKVNGKTIIFGLKPKGLVFESDFSRVRCKGFNRDEKKVFLLLTS